MQHVAQIEGLQTNILSHIPQHLCLMAQVSKDWITPSRNQASSVIMQKSDEFITTLNTWSSEKKLKEIGSDIAKRRSSIEFLEQENGELRQISHPTKLPSPYKIFFRQTNATNPHPDSNIDTKIIWICVPSSPF